MAVGKENYPQDTDGLSCQVGEHSFGSVGVAGQRSSARLNIYMSSEFDFGHRTKSMTN